MTSVFGEEPGAGAFVYFDGEPGKRPKCVVTLIEDLLEAMQLAESDVQIAVSKTLSWRTFSWSAIEKALANPDLDQFRVLVGSEHEARLVCEVQTRHWRFLRRDPEPGEWRRHRPPAIWMFARETCRPKTLVRDLAYRWFRTAARLGRPVSGGATANAITEDLRNEVSLQFSHTAIPDWKRQPVARELFDWFLAADREALMHDRIRRLYPVSLLGPRFVTTRNVELLREAGASVEQVKDSLIVTTAPGLVSAWDPEFMGKTAALRKFAWPISIQNPIDYEGLGREHWFKIDPRESRPQYPTPDEMKTAMTAFREAVAARMPATLPSGELEFAPGSEAPPVPPIQQRDDFTEALGYAR